MSFSKALASKLKKRETSTFHVGFDTEKRPWFSSGNYALNILLSGNYRKAFQCGKSVVISGESGSGKSLVLSTTAREAQRTHNAVVVWMDIEKASDTEFFKRLGVDTSEDNFVFLQPSTIEEVKGVVSSIVEQYDEDKKKGKTPRPVLICIDSYSASMTNTEMEYAKAGDLKGDQGQQAKQLKNVAKSFTHLIARRNISLLGVAQSMQSQDKYAQDQEVILGGRGIIYMAHWAFVFTKRKLKADKVEATAQEMVADEFDVEDEEPTREKKNKYPGIQVTARLYKSRQSKPNEMAMLQVVWGNPEGLDRYSGLLDLMIDYGMIAQVGKTKRYIGPTQPVAGVPEKFETKKDFRKYALTILEHFQPDEDLVEEPEVNPELVDEE